jgi:hypothetical protein
MMLVKITLTICLLGFYLLVPYFVFRIGADTLRLCQQLRELYPFLVGAMVVVGAMVAMALVGFATMGLLQALDALWKDTRSTTQTRDVEMTAGTSLQYLHHGYTPRS